MAGSKGIVYHDIMLLYRHFSCGLRRVSYQGAAGKRQWLAVWNRRSEYVHDNRRHPVVTHHAQHFKNALRAEQGERVVIDLTSFAVQIRHVRLKRRWTTAFSLSYSGQLLLQTRRLLSIAIKRV